MEFLVYIYTYTLSRYEQIHQILFHNTDTSFTYRTSIYSLFLWFQNVNLTRLTLSWRRTLLYRNQSIDLLCKSMYWFLYDRDLRQEGVNVVNKNVRWITDLVKELSDHLLSWSLKRCHHGYLMTKYNNWLMVLIFCRNSLLVLVIIQK